MKRYTSTEVIATELSWNISDLKEHRYHCGFTDKPIYSIDNEYYCASPIGKKPAKHREIDYIWKIYNSKFAESIGWQIWISDNK